jgi:hypothetical protein
MEPSGLGEAEGLEERPGACVRERDTSADTVGVGSLEARVHQQPPDSIASMTRIDGQELEAPMRRGGSVKMLLACESK